MKVAVIGSNGFIGRQLVEHLSGKADLDLYLFGQRNESNFKGKLPYAKIDFFDNERLKADFAGIDFVYYLASETIPATSWNDPIIEVQKNLLPFLNFTETVAKHGLKKIAFVSSAGTVYGATSGKVNEEHDKKPFSPYGIMKLTMENFLRYYKMKYNLSFDVFRISNVYGEGQDVSKGLGAINTFLEKILKKEDLQIFGDGNATRNYVYIKDVSSLLGTSLANLNSSEIFNLSSDATVSLNEIINIIKKCVDEDFNVNYMDSRLSDNSFVDFDNSKILKMLPEFKFTSLEEGIARTYRFLKEKN